MKRLLLNINCVLLILALATSCSDKLGLPPMEETFSKRNKDPFGSFVLHQQLTQFYYHNSVRDVKKNFDDTWRNIEDTGAVYINISRNLFLTKADLSAMLSFAYTGNSVFISSNHIEQALLDTLGCTVKTYEGIVPEMKFTAVELTPDVYHDSTAFGYFYFPFLNHFSKIDKNQSVVLGKNRLGPNFIVVFYGRGRFYIHTDPRALSNYFLLQKDNYKYLRHLFAFTPSIPEHVYWDDYYNKKNYRPREEGSRSGFAVLLQYPSMAWAFWLSLILLTLYIFFGGKRRQRIVGIIPPNINTTLAFTQTIGRLYLQKKDNRNIADKLITYFMEHIRNQYYLNTGHINEEFIATLARKANSTNDNINSLFVNIREIQQSESISDEQLLLLNQQIEDFYKNKI